MTQHFKHIWGEKSKSIENRPPHNPTAWRQPKNGNDEA